MAFSKGLLLAALLLAPCVVRAQYAASSPAATGTCTGAGCDPSTHEIDVAVHYQSDDGSDVSTCTSLLDLLASRDDCSQWYSLVKYFDSRINFNTLSATLYVPSNKAINKVLANFNYNWDSFMALDNARKIIMLQYLIVQVTATTPLLYTSVVNWNYPAVTNMDGNLLTLRPNKWRAYSIADGDEVADIHPGCADLKSCTAVVHVIDYFLLPDAYPLPAMPPPNRGCLSLWDWLSTKGEYTHFVNATGLAANISSTITLKSYFQDQRFAATVFLPTDQIWAKWIKATNPANDTTVTDIDQLSPVQIRDLIVNHVVGGVQKHAADFVSGLMLDTVGLRWLLTDRENGRVRLWADESSAYVVTPDLGACSVVIHLINYPLIPAGSNFTGYAAGDAALNVLPRPGTWNLLGDLICNSPKLSGFRDLVKGTSLEELMNDAKLLSTWFIPTNAALLEMAAYTGTTTNIFFNDVQKRLNFLNYCVIPYSTLPQKSLGDQQKLLTAYRPHSITIENDNVTFAVQGEGLQGLPSPYYDVAVADVVAGQGMAQILDEGALYTSFSGY